MRMMEGKALANIMAVLIAGATLTLPRYGHAAVDLGGYGVGYSATVIPPSGMNATYLGDIVSFYNTGAPTSITIGSGKGATTYSFTKDQGSATPAAPNLPAPTKLNSEITSFTGQGTASATINLGGGGFEYLIGQWDGPKGADAVYYIGGLSGVITLDNRNPIFGSGSGGSAYGLSGFWLGGDNSIPANPVQNVIPVPEATIGPEGGVLLLVLISICGLRGQGAWTDSRVTWSSLGR